MKSNCIYKAL